MKRSNKAPAQRVEAAGAHAAKGPAWVHGEHPERTSPTPGQEPPRQAESPSLPQRIDR
jgi:hypothetical protein